MSAQVDYAALIHEINQRLAKRQTGTMFLKSNDGKSYAVAFQSGSIIGVWSGVAVGNAAVEKLLTIKHASYSINPGAFTPSGSKPDPSYVSLLLGSGEGTPSDATEVVSGGHQTEFHQHALAMIKRNLLDVLGPFAMHVLDEALNSSSYEYIDTHNLQQFLLTLAEEIDDSERAELFVQSTISALNVKFPH